MHFGSRGIKICQQKNGSVHNQREPELKLKWTPLHRGRIESPQLPSLKSKQVRKGHRKTAAPLQHKRAGKLTAENCGPCFPKPPRTHPTALPSSSPHSPLSQLDRLMPRDRRKRHPQVAGARRGAELLVRPARSVALGTCGTSSFCRTGASEVVGQNLGGERDPGLLLLFFLGE